MLTTCLLGALVNYSDDNDPSFLIGFRIVPTMLTTLSRIVAYVIPTMLTTLV